MRSVYEACFYGGLILAILFLITAIILFIVLKIPKVFNELTGRAAKKAMQDMKDGKTTVSDMAKQEQKKYYNQSTGKITIRDTVAQKPRNGATTGNLTDTGELSKEEVQVTDADETAVLNAAGGRKTGPGNNVRGRVKKPKRVVDEEETAVLSSDDDDMATEVLSSDFDNDEETAVLAAQDADDEVTDILRSDDDEATDILRGDDDEEATDVLRTPGIDDEDATSVLTEPDDIKLARKVKVLYNVIITHTDEKL